MTDELLTLLIALAIAVALFFLLRPLHLWYWRVEDRIKKQNDQIDLAKVQAELLAKQNTMLHIMLQLQMGDNDKIAISHKSTGKVKQLTLGELLKDYSHSIHEYDIVVKK